MNKWVGAAKLLLALSLVVIAAGCSGGSPPATERKPQPQEKAEAVVKPTGPGPTITPARTAPAPTPMTWATAVAPPTTGPPAKVLPIAPSPTQPAARPAPTQAPAPEQDGPPDTDGTVLPAWTPAPLPPGGLRLDVWQINSSLRPGSHGRLLAKTAPGADCVLSINNPSGQTELLERQLADNSGYVTWEFGVGSQSQPGTWRLVVTATLGDSSVTKEVTFQMLPSVPGTALLTPTSTPSPTATVKATASPSPAATATATATPRLSFLPTVAPTPTSAPSPSPTIPATPSSTAGPAATLIPTPSALPTPRP